jgi:hypothetical protein
MAAGKIDDRQASHPQDDVFLAMESFIVGATMHHGARHPPYLIEYERSAAGAANDAYDSTHVRK